MRMTWSAVVGGEGVFAEVLRVPAVPFRIAARWWLFWCTQ